MPSVPTRRSALRAQQMALAIACLVTLLWSMPLWDTVGKTGGLDWGFFQNQWEVRWKTLWHYGQLPALNPWQGGGLPDNPTPGYVSVQGVATLVFGAKAGLSIFLITYLLVGTWGYFKLGGVLFDHNTKAQVFLAIVGPASPALAFHLAAGHVIIASLLAWPAILFYLLTAESNLLAGLWAGILFGISFNETPYYIGVYGCCILAIGFATRLLSGKGDVRRSLGRFAGFFLCSAFVIVLPTLIAIFAVAADYQRVANTPFSLPPSILFSSYFLPATALHEYSGYFESAHMWWGAWELKAYLGWGAFFFWTLGLVLGRPRWFHFAMVGTLFFALGNLYFWEPMRWLMLFPPFSSHQSFNRLRLFVMMFFAIGSAWGFHRILNRWIKSIPFRRLIYLASLAATLEIVTVSNLISRNAHKPGLPAQVLNEENGDFYQRAARFQRLPDPYGGWPADLALYTNANIGIVSESAAIPSQFREGNQKTAVVAMHSPGYTGEFSQGGHPVKPDYWSPNRIVFSELTPNLPLRVNLNRGNPWHNFGVPLFPHDRIVEFGLPFVVMPDSAGNVSLTYHLPYSFCFWFTTALAVIGLLCVPITFVTLKSKCASFPR